MIGPLTRWRNRRAVKALVGDAEFLAEIAEADRACADDLVVLDNVGAGPDFGDLVASRPDPATDFLEAPCSDPEQL